MYIRMLTDGAKDSVISSRRSRLVLYIFDNRSP